MDNTQKVKDKIEEKHEMAGLFSELAFNAIHELSNDKKGNSTWTEDQKVMAHALVGYVSGELADSKSSFTTALAAGVNKFVTEEILKDEKTYKHYQEHPEELQWISAALGSAIGQMAGGDATSGASIAASGTKNNWLYKDEQEELAKNIRKITNKKFLDEQDIQQLTELMQEAGLISKENIAMDPIHSENIIPELRSALNSIRTTDFIGVKFKTDDSIGLDKNIENFNNDFAKTYYEYKPLNDTIKDFETGLIREGISFALLKNPYIAPIVIANNVRKVGYNFYEAITEKDRSKWEQGSSDAVLMTIQKIAGNTGGLNAKEKILFGIMQAVKDAAINNKEDKVKKNTSKKGNK